MNKKRHTALVRTDPTAFGPHYWGTWTVCERKAWLIELERTHQEPGELSGVIYFDVGTILHALLALHYGTALEARQAIDTTRVKYVTAAGPLDVERYSEAIYEAERLFRAYRVYWGWNDLGKIVAVEKELEMTLPRGQTITFSSQTITGGLDLISKMSARDLKKNGLQGEPGLYLHDHKTRSKKDPYEYEMACHDLQFSTYAKLVETAEKKWGPVRGFIVNLIYKGTTPSFGRILISKDALEAEWKVSEGLYQVAFQAKRESLRVLEAGGLPTARTRACFKKSIVGWDICPFYKSRQCDRQQKGS